MKSMRKHSGGQALVEMGIVVLLLVVLMFGIIEFGRMMMIANMVTHSARDGARFAAIQPAQVFDDNGGTLPAGHDVENHIHNIMCSTLSPAVCAGLSIAVDRVTLPGTLGAGVSVTVSGNIPYLFDFGIWDTGLAINRVVTFRAEN